MQGLEARPGASWGIPKESSRYGIQGGRGQVEKSRQVWRRWHRGEATTLIGGSVPVGLAHFLSDWQQNKKRKACVVSFLWHPFHCHSFPSLSFSLRWWSWDSLGIRTFLLWNIGWWYLFVFTLYLARQEASGPMLPSPTLCHLVHSFSLWNSNWFLKFQNDGSLALWRERSRGRPYS